VLSVVGNAGSANDIDIDSQDIRILDAAGTSIRQPFTPAKTATADGESVRTTFVTYDSLGTPLSVDLTMVLAAKTSSGTQWRYFVESAADTDLDLQAGNGLINFDTSGQLIPPGTAQVTINRANTGAADPLAFTISFTSEADRVTALTDGPSAIAATFQDGSPLGTLATYAVGPDGIITGAFTNGLTRTVGQVALAKFANPGGLVDSGSNLFTVGPNSGTAVVTARRISAREGLSAARWNSPTSICPGVHQPDPCLDRVQRLGPSYHDDRPNSCSNSWCLAAERP